MDIKAENKKRIEDLEAEFSDDKMAELFGMNEDGEIFVSSRQGRLTGRVLLKRLFIALIIVIAITILLQFFIPVVAVEESLWGTVMERDCFLVAKYWNIDIDDIVAYEVHDTHENGGIHIHFGRVTGFLGNLVEIEYGGSDERLRYARSDQIIGKVLFRALPVSRGGMIS